MGLSKYKISIYKQVQKFRLIFEAKLLVYILSQSKNLIESKKSKRLTESK